jgi:cell division protein FtsB
MKCPVCSSSGIPDDHSQCPQCLSDLEAFQLTGQIQKTSKSSFVMAIVSSLLFIIILLAWIFSFFYQNEDVKSADVKTESNEAIQMKGDYDKAIADNNSLKKENGELKERLKTLAVEKVKRKKEYKVLDGETLYGISRKVYGNGYKYVDLAKENNIQEPDKLKVGQTLVIYY